MPRIIPQLQRRISLLVSVVSPAAVAWWISKQDTPQFPDSPKGWAYLLAAFVLCGLAFTVRGFRWHRILRLIHISHKRSADGAWRRADREGVADAHYRDHFTSDGVGPDGVVAAEADVCLHLVKPS